MLQPLHTQDLSGLEAQQVDLHGSVALIKPHATSLAFCLAAFIVTLRSTSCSPLPTLPNRFALAAFSRELTRECLDRIERLNPALNAFITVTADTALDDARQAEAEIVAGNCRGPLHGIPIGLKDLFDTAGVRTTAASNQYRDRVPAEDAEIVRRLKQAGAVILGKLNMHEFAFGMSGVVSAFGPTKNPWNTERISGGSSSGSAAAVAAGCASRRWEQTLPARSDVPARCAALWDIGQARA